MNKWLNMGVSLLIILGWGYLAFEEFIKIRKPLPEQSINHCLCQENGSCYRGSGNDLSKIVFYEELK